MYIDGSIRKYIDDASSNKPAPGGGSIASLAGTAGLSMACMAANFTVGKKKFKEVEHRVNELLGKCASDRDELLLLMDEDVQAYSQVSAAYGMPKASPEEKKARAKAIQNALKIAMDAPLRAVRLCREALGHVAELADIANPNLISDVGVAAILTEAYEFCERVRNRWFLVNSAPSDSMPTQPESALWLARSLDTEPGVLREHYRRVTRRSRSVVERVFYGLPAKH